MLADDIDESRSTCLCHDSSGTQSKGWAGYGEAEFNGAAGAPVELGELVFGAGEADLEAFDLAQPAFVFGANGWLGEVQGLEASLTKAKEKLASLDRSEQRRQHNGPVNLGMPIITDPDGKTGEH